MYLAELDNLLWSACSEVTRCVSPETCYTKDGVYIYLLDDFSQEAGSMAS